jgi:hypothetical protein
VDLEEAGHKPTLALLEAVAHPAHGRDGAVAGLLAHVDVDDVAAGSWSKPQTSLSGRGDDQEGSLIGGEVRRLRCRRRMTNTASDAPMST